MIHIENALSFVMSCACYFDYKRRLTDLPRNATCHVKLYFKYIDSTDNLFLLKHPSFDIFFIYIDLYIKFFINRILT